MSALTALPENIATAFEHLIDGVWDGRVDPGLLEACRIRVTQLVGAPESAGQQIPPPTPAPLDEPRTAACIAFAEMWVVDPHAVTDEMAATVRRYLTDREVAAFTIGLATIEAQARMAVALP